MLKKKPRSINHNDVIKDVDFTNILQNIYENSIEFNAEKYLLVQLQNYF